MLFWVTVVQERRGVLVGTAVLYSSVKQAICLLVSVIFLGPFTPFVKQIRPNSLYVVDRVLFGDCPTFRRCAAWGTVTFVEWILNK